MEIWEREYHVNRIVSGLSKVRHKDKTYWVGRASRQARYLGAEIQKESIEECWANGLMSRDDAIQTLINAKIWNEQEESQYKLLGEKLDELKVGLYESWSNASARSGIRNAIKKGRAEHQRLENIKHSLDHLTVEGVSTSARVRFMTGASLLLSDFSPYWTDPVLDWHRHDNLIDIAMEHLAKIRLSETDLRDIARNEPWRSIWSSRTHCGQGLIDIPSVDLMDEQRSLILWSSVYDSIRDHPEAPSDDAFDDDDMLDGWMIIQRKAREANMIKKRGEEISKNPKIKNADEIYKFVESAEDARKIESLNSAVSKNIKKQRLDHLKKFGQVDEAKMPDTARKNQMELNRLEHTRRK